MWPVEALPCSWFSNLCVQLHVGICSDLWPDLSWRARHLALFSNKFVVSLSWSLRSENMKMVDVVRFPHLQPVVAVSAVLVSSPRWRLACSSPLITGGAFSLFSSSIPVLLSSLCSPPAPEASPGCSCQAPNSQPEFPCQIESWAVGARTWGMGLLIECLQPGPCFSKGSAVSSTFLFNIFLKVSHF